MDTTVKGEDEFSQMMARNGQGGNMRKQEVEIIWGVELEGYVASKVLYLPDGWTSHKDGSIKPDYACRAIEFVRGPAVYGPKEMDVFKSDLQALNKWNPKANETCGFHVHVSLASWKDTIPNEAKETLLSRFYRDQGFLFSLNGAEMEHRRGNMYCAPLKSESLADYDFEDRYQALNLTAPAKGVELRLFAGTFDSKVVLNTTEITIRWFAATLKGEKLKLPPKLASWADRQKSRSF